MNDPAVLVLVLEQGDRSLKDHTEDFVFLANYTHYPDNCLCSFYFAGLDTSPTHDPVPDPPSPCSVEQQLEPTADGEPEPIATNEPSPKDATELRIATEPEPMTSDQVHEPATELAMGENDEGRIPRLCLQPLSPGLHLGPQTQRLCPGYWLPRLHHRLSAHQLHRAPS
ncbi:hypothetical protein M9458_054763, partial [Cirrhinus mrigala]